METETQLTTDTPQEQPTPEQSTPQTAPAKEVEPLIYSLGAPGRKVSTLMLRCDVPESELPQDLMRDDLDLPEVSELDVVRHFVRLSQKNYAIDTGFYPL